MRTLVAIGLALSLGAWTAPQQLDRGPVGGIVVAGDGAGMRVIAWSTDRGTKLAVAKRGGPFGRPHVVSTTGFEPGGMKLAMNTRGEALLVWHYSTAPPDPGRDPREGEPCCTVVRAVVLRHGGRVSQARGLSRRTKYGYDPVPAVGSGGRIGVAWTEEGKGFASFGTFRKGLGKREAIPASKAPSGLSFDKHHARVEWLRSVTAVKEAVRTAPRRYSRPTTLLRAGVLNNLVLAADGRGRQVATWTDRDRARLGTRTPPAALRQRTLGRAANDFLAGPELAVASSGAAIAAWIGHGPTSNGSDPTVRVTMRGRRGGFGPVKAAFSLPGLAALAGVSVAPGGGAAIGMSTSRPDGHRESRVALLRADGSVRGPDLVVPQLDASFPVVESDARGTAAAWGGFDGTGGKGLWVARSR